jgi:small subunit ribosomal protein S25
MRGAAPWRRSLEYLEKGSLIFKDKVKIFSINYHEKLDESDGLRRFLFWHLAQIQYKNPNVQCLQLKNMINTPLITFYALDEHKKFNKIQVNCYNRSQDDILSWCIKLVGKTKEEIARETAINPANFGAECGRYCICQIAGQVSCPQFKPLPMHLRGKYRFVKKDELEEFRKTKSDQDALKDYWQSA